MLSFLLSLLWLPASLSYLHSFPSAYLIFWYNSGFPVKIWRTYWRKILNRVIYTICKNILPFANIKEGTEMDFILFLAIRPWSRFYTSFSCILPNLNLKFRSISMNNLATVILSLTWIIYLFSSWWFLSISFPFMIWHWIFTCPYIQALSMYLFFLSIGIEVAKI